MNEEDPQQLHEHLLNQVLEHVVENEFLVPIRLKNLNTTPSKEELLFCSSEITVPELKDLIRGRMGVVTGNEECSYEDEEERAEEGAVYSNDRVAVQLLDENMNYLFVDPLVSAEIASSVPMFHFYTIFIDSHTQSLFDLVNMGEEIVRDDMMHRILLGRSPQNCPGNHGLMDEQVDRRTVLRCVKCFRKAFEGRGCLNCSFALCGPCLWEDKGRQPFPKTPTDILAGNHNNYYHSNPYHNECLRIATDWGEQMAGIMESSQSFALVFLTCKARGDEEIQPPNMNGRRSVGKNTRIIARGTRLIIRLCPKLREVVLQQNESVGETVEGPGETNAVFRKGVTLAHLQELGQKLRKLKASWRRVTEYFKTRMIEHQIHNFEDAPNAYIMSMKLISFQPDVVQYEVGAEVSAKFLARNGNGSGRHGIYSQIQASGAILKSH